MEYRRIETEKYCVFSDESHYNTGRFHSIATITLPKNMGKILHNELKEIIKESSIEEFKWNAFNGDYKRTKCANLLTNWVYSHQDIIRLDVLIWDTNDYRHKVKNRDDEKNFSIMYYRIFDHIIKVIPKKITFSFYPDIKDGFDWENIEDYLYIKNNYNIEKIIWSQNDIDIMYIKDSINVIKPFNSKDYIFIQIADLFAGLAVYSYMEYDNFLLWQKQENPQMSLFPETKISFSKSQKARFEFLDNFKHKFKLNMSINKGLCTPPWDKRKSINFWLYKPQRSEDKAPIKTSNMIKI